MDFSIIRYKIQISYVCNSNILAIPTALGAISVLPFRAHSLLVDLLGLRNLLTRTNRVCSHDVRAAMLEEQTKKRRPCWRSEIFFW